MSKITVNESVTRSVSFENNLVDVQTALVRCFQFLEEKRFDEAHAIIEQVLNIDPNNTDAHIANFLYQFRCGRINWLDYNRYNDYLSSVFYHRIYNSAQTSLRAQFMSRISELHKALEAEKVEKAEKRRHKDKEDFRWAVFTGVLLAFTVAAFAWLYFIKGDRSFLALSFVSFIGFLFCARVIYCKNKQMRK